jgi:hypothetical protein
MVAPDPIEKAGILQHDVIRKMKPSEPGNQDLFRKTLKEKLEEDLEQKRRQQQDEVILGRQESDDTPTEHESDDRAQDAQDTPVVDDPDTAAANEKPEQETTKPAHVDIKA